MGEQQGSNRTPHENNGKGSSEEQWAIDRLRQGVIDGLEPLVRKYQVQAIRVAYQITLDRRIAEEIVQEAFLKFYHGIKRFDPDRLFWPYFRRIVTNDALKALESRKREMPFTLVDNSAGVHTVEATVLPDSRLEASEARQHIKDALKQLSPRQRTVIVLYYVEELNEREIATELGIALGTVKRNKYDGRERLVRLLDDHRPKN
jgi:RNA polymerase sigma-70 factor (ECF subfamily)